jgi:glutamate formiminotransferase
VAHVLNRILAVPNWSFFDPSLTNEARRRLLNAQVKVHYCQGDIDHQRTVTAFSGNQVAVFEALDQLADFLLPRIDLRVQSGVHPRVGALDVAPFVLLEGSETHLIRDVNHWAARLSDRFQMPVHLYEKSAEGGHEYRLPYLRGQLGNTEQLPNFGSLAHERWGTTVVGVRDFLLATNINFAIDDPSDVKYVAKELRFMRDHGNPDLQGVRALGFTLESQCMTQLSLNLTQPNLTSFDRVMEVANELLDGMEIFIIETELIGVIRSRDLHGATTLSYDPSQVVS